LVRVEGGWLGDLVDRDEYHGLSPCSILTSFMR